MVRRISRKETTGEKDSVDRAIARTINSIGRIIALLDGDNLELAEKARAALRALGAKAVFWPLATSLLKSPSPSHRIGIVAALVVLSDQVPLQVIRLLTTAQRREKHPEVILAINRAIDLLIRCEDSDDGRAVEPPDSPAEGPR